MDLKAPFPYFGGKIHAAETVWRHFGNPPNYVEPFCGSLAVLLARPGVSATGRIETVNDADAMLANFWRAIQEDPVAVARWADWPVSEVDLHARHRWLQGHQPALRERLLADPGYHDTKAAGWWVWGMCAWPGGGWCSYKGSCLPLPALANGGRGVHRLGLSGAKLIEYFQALSIRLRKVRICSGDWTRVLTPAVTIGNGITAVFLDPPYAADRSTTYTHDNRTISRKAREWALAHGDDSRYRIALCGLEGEHRMPASWHMVASRLTGYGRRGDRRGKQNLVRERIWFSPHCRHTPSLFEAIPRRHQETVQVPFMPTEGKGKAPPTPQGFPENATPSHRR